jgi:DNA invertase Pin-like site-specific DNA recombinase
MPLEGRKPEMAALPRSMIPPPLGSDGVYVMSSPGRGKSKTVKPFAFYGRVSTEDQQDPASSRAWQLRRAVELIEPAGGEIVVEFFDVGQSRSLPWKRRPEASRLLEHLRSADRGFEAVAIGEPQRAFYGAQFALTFPLFEHYGVELWVPEVGGRVDPGSEAHDMVMTLFGGMSKGERSRIRTRVRNAMAAQAATQGRFLGGRPPYGYRLADAGPHPNPGKGALGIRIHRLEPDAATGPVVVRIFEEYVSGRGLFAIAEGLTRDGVLSPSAYDRARNPHRNGEGWSKSAVRAILINPRYTGVAVWGRQRRDEVLVDVEDVAAGHRTRLRWNDEDEWVRSPGVAHKPLISQDIFEAARARREANGRTTIRKPRATPRPYLLRGLLRCGLCDRRMQGSWNHKQAYYRCRYPTEYALPRRAQHPPTVYVREAQIVPPLDDWIAGIFEPDRLEETCRAVAEAQEPAPEEDGRAEAASRSLADCDARLARYRKALDAGTDPAVVARWISEVQAERRAAEEELRQRGPTAALTEDDIRAMIESLEDPVGVLGAAEPAKKAALYESLGLALRYEPSKRRVLVEADLRGVRPVRVGGGI